MSNINYNLYRIFCAVAKSQNGIAFRKWATQILKNYMLKGYAVIKED